MAGQSDNKPRKAQRATVVQNGQQRDAAAAVRAESVEEVAPEGMAVLTEAVAAGRIREPQQQGKV